MKSEPIVFFGTGQISLASLEAVSGSWPVEAVITKPDTEIHGRTVEPPVKTWARSRKIPVWQPANKEELGNLFKDREFKARMGLVVDYGLIIPDSVIDYFPLGIVNSHFSLLPEWRGADPITAAFLSGQATTGVSLMLIEPSLDTGPIIARAEYKIPPDTTVKQLTDELVRLSNQLLLDRLPEYLSGRLKPSPQPKQPAATYAPKISKADGQIDWSKPAAVLEREIRAYQGWPGSYSNLKGIDLTVTKARTSAKNGVVGQVFIEDKDLGVYCGQDALIIERLKPAGKREMSTPEFLAGYRQKLGI